MQSSLFGPDASDEPIEEILEVGDTVEVWSRQFVNRWVFLKHQRPHALKELEELLACHTGIVTASVKQAASGTAITAPSSDVAPADNGSPTRTIGAKPARTGSVARD